ncbi:UNVERIFIED_CONTAM: protein DETOXIFICATION 56 [Sesamum angustifolium]|uniref:Protein DETOXIFICATION 56 n=1 Tax=Sesamum angustifolium TaxID=2727405 RepID=A0AAW2MLK2_9LAMI
MEQTTLESSPPPAPLAPPPRWPPSFNHTALYSELKTQWRITVPLVAMNLTWFAKIAITTAFLGRLGELPLAGATLGFTFANVTGFSVLNGLCGAMEPICGQAFGAKNFRLLHKTLVMATSLLLAVSVPVAFLWLNVDKILIHFGQQRDIAVVAKNSALAVALHVPVNVFLSRVKGLEGISMAVWISDFVVMALLGSYVLVAERRKGGKWKEEGGRLPNATQSVGVIAIVLNFDYLLFSVMLSLATCASVRVSNELGANRPKIAYQSAYISLVISILSGFAGGSTMAAARGIWGPLYSHDRGIIRGVKRTMLLMAIIEVVNFPLAVCGGIVRGTARPWLGMYANIFGFYLLALPLGVVLAFKVGLGLGGLLMGFMAGVVACLVLLLVFIARINWDNESDKAQMLTCHQQEVDYQDNEEHTNPKPIHTIA